MSIYEKDGTNQLRRVTMRFIHKEMLSSRDPVVAVSTESSKVKPVFIAFPYSRDMEKKLMQKHLSLVADKKAPTYDEYRKLMLETALEQLQDGKILVTPGHVINSENLEETKKQNKLMATELLLQAAKFWAGSQEWQICPHCGHQMLPKGIIEERKLAADVPAELLDDGKTTKTITANP